jgi:hypothetical protein
MAAPTKKFNVKDITISVWENEGKTKDGKTFTSQSLTIQKNYKDREGKWQSGNSFRFDDIPYLVDALGQAFAFKYRRGEIDDLEV